MKQKIEHLRLYFSLCGIAGLCLMVVRHKFPDGEMALEGASWALLGSALIGSFLHYRLRKQFQAEYPLQAFDENGPNPK